MNVGSMAIITARRIRDFAGQCAALAMEMAKLSAHQMCLDYDKEADVLCVSFRKPQRATDAIEWNNNLLVREDGKDVVGLTIMNASTEWHIKRGKKDGCCSPSSTTEERHREPTTDCDRL
jgi:uncharacterized protein YuzE